jgi:drug/metabolite transporter (DMT)-like permease
MKYNLYKFNTPRFAFYLRGIMREFRQASPFALCVGGSILFCFGIFPSPFQPSPNHTMIEPSTIQTLLEVAMLAFLGTLAILLWD